MSVIGRPRPHSGFTLIEVLITLTILVFGLLGLAGLIIKGNRAAFEVYQRQQALAIAGQMAERIKANQVKKQTTPTTTPDINKTLADRYVVLAPLAAPIGDPAVSGPWENLQLGSLANCAATTCTRDQLAQYDVAIWEGLLLGVTETATVGARRLGGLINARGCIEGPLGAPAAGEPLTYRVSVAWQGDSPTSVQTASACGDGLGLYQTQNPADPAPVHAATRRLVTLDITLFEPL